MEPEAVKEAENAAISYITANPNLDHREIKQFVYQEFTRGSSETPYYDAAAITLVAFQRLMIEQPERAERIKKSAGRGKRQRWVKRG